MKSGESLLIGFILCLFWQNAWLAQESTNERLNAKVLNVGKELREEILPLNMGQALYEIHGSKKLTWYEVKISYPASIPASFSIDILKDNSTKAFNLGRRLLNTEKIIFNSNRLSLDNKVFASVSVKPEGVVAKSYSREHDFVIYNIVCDELFYGLPLQVWWVGFLALLCFIISCLVPYFGVFDSVFLFGRSDYDDLKRDE